MEEVVPKSRCLNVLVVRSPPLLPEVGRNGRTTPPMGPIIRSPPIEPYINFAIEVYVEISFYIFRAGCNKWQC